MIPLYSCLLHSLIFYEEIGDETVWDLWDLKATQNAQMSHGNEKLKHDYGWKKSFFFFFPLFYFWCHSFFLSAVNTSKLPWSSTCQVHRSCCVNFLIIFNSGFHCSNVFCTFLYSGFYGSRQIGVYIQMRWDKACQDWGCLFTVSATILDFLCCFVIAVCFVLFACLFACFFCVLKSWLLCLSRANSISLSELVYSSSSVLWSLGVFF